MFDILQQFFDKAWGIATIFISSLLGFFMYSTKKMRDDIDKLRDDYNVTARDHHAVKQSLIDIKHEMSEIKREIQQDICEIKGSLDEINKHIMSLIKSDRKRR